MVERKCEHRKLRYVAGIGFVCEECGQVVFTRSDDVSKAIEKFFVEWFGGKVIAGIIWLAWFLIFGCGFIWLRFRVNETLAYAWLGAGIIILLVAIVIAQVKLLRKAAKY